MREGNHQELRDWVAFCYKEAPGKVAVMVNDLLVDYDRLRAELAAIHAHEEAKALVHQ